MWCLDGFVAAPARSAWAQTTVIIARSRCRFKWFRLQGVPLAERVSALRLQAQAWRPFESHSARLIVWQELGLAIAWDAAALERDLVEHGLKIDQCHLIPELLLQQSMDGGVRIVQGLEGFEAQCWQSGQLQSSRWWPMRPSAAEWLSFLRSAGQTGATDESNTPTHFDVPDVIQLPPEALAWVKHYALQAASNAVHRQLEGRLVYGGAVLLALAAGAAAHSLYEAWRLEAGLKAQLAELKAKADSVIAVRERAISELAAVQRLANFAAVPQPIEVIGHLHDTLARTGVQVKELELEGERLKVGLQLGPNVARASLVKDLQSGGWFADVNEARGDGGGRTLLTLELRIKGAHAPVVGAEEAPTASPPAPNGAQQVSTSLAPSSMAPAPGPAAKPPAGGQRQRTAPPPAEPFKPIFAKPDANGMPPADVFDAIPSR